MSGTRASAAALLAACAACALPLAAAAAAAPVRLRATATPGQEVPKQAVRNAKAAGTFAATVVPAKDGYRLRWRLTFRRLTGRATSAFIHVGRRGGHGAAMVLLCSPCASGATGSAYFSPSELVLARQGKLYVNVRTARNPAGEVRGQVAVA